MNEISVFGKPGCYQCKYTTKAFDKLNVSYNYIDMSIDLAAEQRVKDLGFNAIPVVVTKHDKWAGFRPDKIQEEAKIWLQDNHH